MARKEYIVYRIKTPSGMYYVGYTTQKMSDRWRHHKNRAFTDASAEHPLYHEIRTYHSEDFSIEILHRTYDRREAMELEKKEIALLPTSLSLNLSSGGLNDAAEGGRIFWERLNQNPEARKAYLQKLSERKLADDWTDYEALKAAQKKWCREHPREAYRSAYRNIRIALKKNGQRPPCYVAVDERPLKERLMHKHKLNEVRRQYVTRVWSERSESERAAIGQKISDSAKRRMGEKTLEERRQITEKARSCINHEKQGRAASNGLKNWWAQLREKPEEYREYIERRKRTRRENANLRHTERRS